MKLAILGAGAWGTALAISLSAAHGVRLWTRSPQDAERIARERLSPYLPQARLPEAVALDHDIGRATRDADLVLVATATAGLREVCGRLAALPPPRALLWACKGFEQPSLALPHQVVAETLPGCPRVGVLSGPSFAQEVAAGLPTAVLLASRQEAFANETMAALNSPRLRIYSSTDVLGVELGGAVKNVMAIAAGIADGLALGHNARAALVTRGLAEMVRLGVALGGRAETFMGLAGVGDLVLTCTGALSRNRAVGVELGRGRRLAEILAGLGHVAEGVTSAGALRGHGRRLAVEMPITEAVCAVLEGALGPAAAVERLLAREPKPELQTPSSGPR